MVRIEPKDIPNEDVIELVKKDLKNIEKWMADHNQTFSNISWKKFANKAKTILKKIQAAHKLVLGEQGGLTKALAYKQLKTQNKYLQEVKHIHLLQAYLTEGYVFIQEFRSFVKKEKLEYLILFDDKNSQSMGRYTLEQLLPTLNIRINSEKEFALQINNVQRLRELKDLKEVNQNGQNEDEIYKQIIDLYNDIRMFRYALVQEARIAKETAEEREKRGDRKKSGYEFGQAGIAFEVAARKAAAAIAAGMSIGDIPAITIAQEQFKVDTQAFYKGGDLSLNLVHQLFKKQQKVALELKRVSTAEGSVGAQLAKQSTIENTLQKIIDCIQGKDKKSQDEIYKNLQDLFSSKEKSIENEVEEIIQAKISDALNSTVGKVKTT